LALFDLEGFKEAEASPDPIKDSDGDMAIFGSVRGGDLAEDPGEASDARECRKRRPGLFGGWRDQGFGVGFEQGIGMSEFFEPFESPTVRVAVKGLESIVKIPTDTAQKSDGIVGQRGRVVEGEELDVRHFAHPEDLCESVVEGASPDEGELIEAAFDQQEVFFVKESGKASDLARGAWRSVWVEGGGVLGVVKAQEERRQQAFDKAIPRLFFKGLAGLIEFLAVFPSQVEQSGQSRGCAFFECGEQKAASAVVEIAHGFPQIEVAALPKLEGFEASAFKVETIWIMADVASPEIFFGELGGLDVFTQTLFLGLSIQKSPICEGDGGG